MERKHHFCTGREVNERVKRIAIFGLAPGLICSHLLWMIAMFWKNEVFLNITLTVLIAFLIIVGGGFLVAAVFSWRKYNSLQLLKYSNPLIRQYNQKACIFYIGTLLMLVLVCTIVPETEMLLLSLPPVFGIVSMILISYHYYKLYTQGDQASETLTEANGDMRVWEKYLAYLNVSESIDAWFFLTLSVMALIQGVAPFASDMLLLLLNQINGFMWLMQPLIIIYEIFKLSKKHDQIMKSKPQINKGKKRMIGIAGFVILVLMPIIKRIALKGLPILMVDTLFFWLSIIVALLSVGMAIYFWAYKSKYNKADTLAW